MVCRPFPIPDPRSLIPLITLLLLLLSSLGRAYDIPETLHYRLEWMGIGIGKSALETASREGGVEIVSSVWSAAWTAPFYRVDDFEVSWLDETAEGFVQQGYGKSLLEGPLQVKRAISLDREGRLIRHVNLLTGVEYHFPLEGTVWDPVAMMFHLRRLPLELGDTLEVALLDNDRPTPVRVEVVRRERVETPAGAFDTLVLVSSSALNTEGLFYARGTLTVWLTDDARKLPVRLEKRIPGLFAQGVPGFLLGLLPGGEEGTPRAETIRAELTSDK